MTSLKIIQVVPRIANASSGPSLSVPSMCCAIRNAGCDVELFALEPEPGKYLFDNTRLFPSRKWPLSQRFGVSPRMKEALSQAAISSQIIHTNSLWMMPNIYPASAVRGTNCKLVISPRGTLSPWALSRSRMRKRVVNWLGQRRCLESASCIHATSLEELSEIRKAGLSNPVAVIPNGVACPTTLIQRADDNAQKTLLFLARIHPTKGVDVLLDAWQNVQSEFPDWRLKIAGPNDNLYAKQMITRSLSLRDVDFCGELAGDAKTKGFQDANLYVLPTHSENFGISVAEALSYGVPAIVFHGAPWQGLIHKNAGWWVEPGVASLAASLRIAMTHSSSELRQLGRNGHQWMQHEFDWQVIGKRMAAVYEWLVNGGDRPTDIVLD